MLLRTFPAMVLTKRQVKCPAADVSHQTLVTIIGFSAHYRSTSCTIASTFRRDNVHLLTYEDMKRDPIKSIQEIISFLGLTCPELKDTNSAKFQNVLKESGIDAMKDYVQENYKKAMGGAAEAEW